MFSHKHSGLMGFMVSVHSRFERGTPLMFGTRPLRFLAASLAAGLLYFSYSGPALAQATPATPADQDAKMRILQQRVDDLGKQLKQMQDEQTKTSKTVST